jgi:GNAT superfamily N-acetyltransferase
MLSATVSIIEWRPGDAAAPLLAQINEIFWEASARAFPPGPERDAFRDRWLGRYMHGGSDVVLLAISAEATLAGYLVGAMEDPSQQARFDDLPYLRQEFAHLAVRFPAHLHINLAAAFRGRGIGARLIEAFAERARRAGAPGMHVVTGKGMRNVTFYLRCGFVELAAAPWNGGTILFLGKSLGA